jgi:BirA family transcriptional regulator, biotin operon repressor / biotin---[acetyl-CoA-carboxylase] ligase
LKKYKHWYRDYHLLIFDEIDSTNEEAKRLIRSGVTGDFVIVAKSQTRGKGRLGRYWASPYGNLYTSILFNPKFDIELAPQISFLAAIAMGEVLGKIVDPESIKYKWPNDIFLNGKKVAGILIESISVANDSTLRSMIIGFGVNIVKSPEYNTYPVTNLLLEGAELTSPDEFLNDFMKEYLALIDLWQKEGFEPIRKKWLERAFGLGGQVSTYVNKKLVTGTFSSIDKAGNLVIKHKERGTIKSSGQVFFDPLSVKMVRGE